MAESRMLQKLWLRTCASSCVLRRAEARSQPPSSSTAGPCARGSGSEFGIAGLKAAFVIRFARRRLTELAA